MPDGLIRARGPAAVAGHEWPALLDRAVRGNGLTVAFQPIVDLQRGVVAGYEALARFSARPGVSPEVWFAEASRRGRVAQLDAAVLRIALAQRASLPANRFLTINVEPASLLSTDVTTVLDQAGELGGVVLEITEHSRIDDMAGMKAEMARLRGRGAMFALDDAGTGYAGLHQILELRPEILKVDRALVEGIEHDEAKAALVEMVGFFANRINAWVLVEGVETEAVARRCIGLRVPLAQGWFFGRAAPAWSDIEPAAFAAVVDLLDGVDGHGLRSLLTVAPTINVANLDVAATVLATSALEFLVVIAHNDRPVGLLTSRTGLSREPLLPLIANVNSTPAELAHRLSTRFTGDASLPSIVADNAGATWASSRFSG